MKTIKIKADVVLVVQKDITDVLHACSGCVFYDIPNMKECDAANLIADCSIDNEDGERMVFTLRNANIKEKVL